MEKHQLLKEEFNKELIKLMNNQKEKAELLMKDACTDEANLEKIKFNVVDIFSKMFIVSYNNVYGKMKNQNIKNAVDTIEDDYEKLYHAYMVFFDKIPAPWKEKYDKDKEMGMTVECVIEELKLNTAKDIRERFTILYNKYKN